MNTNVTRGASAPLARLGRRIVAIVTECNYAQDRVTSLRNTPGAYRAVANKATEV